MLVECRTCSNQVSKEAGNCPNCKEIIVNDLGVNRNEKIYLEGFDKNYCRV